MTARKASFPTFLRHSCDDDPDLQRRGMAATSALGYKTSNDELENRVQIGVLPVQLPVRTPTAARNERMNEEASAPMQPGGPLCRIAPRPVIDEPPERRQHSKFSGQRLTGLLAESPLGDVDFDCATALLPARDPVTFGSAD
jgi:hypothetical protein